MAGKKSSDSFSPDRSVFQTTFHHSFSTVDIHHCVEMGEPAFTITQLVSLVTGDGLKRDYVSIEEMSPNARLSVIAAEDQLFPDHNGFDWKSIEKHWTIIRRNPIVWERCFHFIATNRQECFFMAGPQLDPQNWKCISPPWSNSSGERNASSKSISMWPKWERAFTEWRRQHVYFKTGSQTQPHRSCTNSSLFAQSGKIHRKAHQ